MDNIVDPSGERTDVHIEKIPNLNANIDTISGIGSLLQDENVSETTNLRFNGNLSIHDVVATVSLYQDLEIYTEILNTDKADISAEKLRRI